MKTKQERRNREKFNNIPKIRVDNVWKACIIDENIFPRADTPPLPFLSPNESHNHNRIRGSRAHQRTFSSPDEMEFT